jgi:cytochrome c553
MKYKLAITLFALLFAGQLYADSLVDGSSEAGQARAIPCSACHGADGNSVNPLWPSIAGQHATYIFEQLQAFKNGRRSNILMSAQTFALTDEDMANLAVYFSEQTPAARAVADESLVGQGQALYRGGDLEEGIPACMACHGPTGSGNPAASYPSLSGQHAAYTALQLVAYRGGERKSDGPTKVMRQIAAELSDEQIEALASYIQGLRR